MQTIEAQLTATAIPAGRLILRGRLHMPVEFARGLVLFAQGGESRTQCPRHQRVEASLHDVGLGTLWCDLLPETLEGADGFNARLLHDIGLLSDRLRIVTRWAGRQPELSDLPFGYFGIGQGAPAALIAASVDPTSIQAVVTRGGRPNVADSAIRNLRTPTLLIVGGNDEAAPHNLEAWARLCCEKSIEIIPGAGHRFEEPGALDNVAALAARWFSEHLGAANLVA
jgi:putative phosphoribosyl transferase